MRNGSSLVSIMLAVVFISMFFSGCFSNEQAIRYLEDLEEFLNERDSHLGQLMELCMMLEEDPEAWQQDKWWDNLRRITDSYYEDRADFSSRYGSKGEREVPSELQELHGRIYRDNTYLLWSMRFLTGATNPAPPGDRSRMELLEMAAEELRELERQIPRTDALFEKENERFGRDGVVRPTEETLEIVARLNTTILAVAEFGEQEEELVSRDDFLLHVPTDTLLILSGEAIAEGEIQKFTADLRLDVEEAVFSVRRGSPNVTDIHARIGKYVQNLTYDLKIREGFDEWGNLKRDYYVQLTVYDLTKDGTREVFVSIGNKLTRMTTTIFEYDETREPHYWFQPIGTIRGQYCMFIPEDEDDKIFVPFGSHGVANIYKIVSGEIVRVDD